eukprot:636427-Rhodomonas_salina.1
MSSNWTLLYISFVVYFALSHTHILLAGRFLQALPGLCAALCTISAITRPTPRTWLPAPRLPSLASSASSRGV